MTPPKKAPHEVIVLIQPVGSEARPVGTAATAADVPELLREIARIWEARGSSAAGKGS